MSDSTQKKTKELVVKDENSLGYAGSHLSPSIYGIGHRIYDSKTGQLVTDSVTISASRRRSWYGISNYPQDASQEHALTYPDVYKRWEAIQLLDLPRRITFGTAEDIWAEFDNPPFDLTTPGKDEFQLIEKNGEIIKRLYETNFYDAFYLATAYALVDGHSMVMLMEDEFDFEKHAHLPWDKSKQVARVTAFPAIQYMIDEFDNATLKPKSYSLDVAATYNKEVAHSRGHVYGPNIMKPTIKIDGSRCIHIVLDKKDITPYGFSVLANCWIYLMVLMNIVIGTGEGFHRWGSGKPVFTTEYETQTKIDAFTNGLGGNPIRKDWFVLPKGVQMTMQGLQGGGLDPMSFEVLCINGIVRVSKIPRPILQGEVTGVQTGSRVNERAYFLMLSTYQRRLRPYIEEYLDLLGYEGEEYFIHWRTHYVESEEDKWNREVQKWNAANLASSFLTIDEIRDMFWGREPLPNGWGGYVLGLNINVTESKEEAMQIEGEQQTQSGSQVNQQKLKQSESNRGDIESNQTKPTKEKN